MKKFYFLPPWSTEVIVAYLFYLTSCMLGNFSCFFVVDANFFQNQLFRKIFSEIPSECQIVWIQLRLDILSGLIWVQTACKGISRRHLGKGLTVV